MKYTMYNLPRMTGMDKHSNGPIFLLDDAAVGRLGHDLVRRPVAPPRRRRHRRRHRRRSGGGRGPLAEARGHILGLHGVAALPVCVGEEETVQFGVAEPFIA